jgi:hypothetical protein
MAASGAMYGKSKRKECWGMEWTMINGVMKAKVKYLITIYVNRLILTFCA